MPFLPPNQQRQSTEGKTVSKLNNNYITETKHITIIKDYRQILD